MSRNVNVSSVSHDGQAMLDPQNFKAIATGRKSQHSAGEDVGVSDDLLVERIIQVQISFNDLATAILMLTTKFGVSGTLLLKTKTPGAGAETTLTVIDALCGEVLIDAQHNEYGAHIALFEAKYTDGSTFPVS